MLEHNLKQVGLYYLISMKKAKATFRKSITIKIILIQSFSYLNQIINSNQPLFNLKYITIYKNNNFISLLM